MKVLIISHNPVSAQSNMGKTFLSLFSAMEPKELCQLYIYPVIPNTARCASYYRITDKDVLKSILRMKAPGRELLPEQISKGHGLYEHAQDQALYKNRKNKSAVRRMCRDAMWQISGWYSTDLKQWLNREKPECIFVAPGVARFTYDFALRIHKELDIPIVTYICDEFYFVKQPAAALDRFRLGLLQRKMEALLKETDHLVVISEELKAEYERKFGVQTTLLMTGATAGEAQKAEPEAAVRNICFFGNVRCNRFVPLAQIGQTLDRINEAQGQNYRLKIYSAEKDPQVLQNFAGIQCVDLCGFVAGEAFVAAMADAHVLIHTEAFDEASMDFTQHSISTKIADSLASGIPLFAYGPECISSMKHVIRNRCAVVATSEQMLRDALQTVLTDRKARRAVVANAQATAERFHDSAANGKMLREILAHTSGK